MCNKIIFDKIKVKVAQIDRLSLVKDRQQRIGALVSEWGLEAVALASGWSTATIKVYLSSKKTQPSISLDSLMQAEQILKSINE